MTSLAVLLLAAFAVPVFANVVLYLDRRRVIRGSCEANDPLPWSSALRAFLIECVAFAAPVAAPVLRTMGPSSTRGGKNHLVILVAGDGLGASSFWLLERRLAARGWDTTLLKPDWRQASLDRVAEELGERILREPDRSRFVLVSVLAFGCSGLLVRRWLRDQAPGVVHQFITLGTPHRGTFGMISRIGRFRLAHPSSDFLRGVAEQDPVPRRYDTIAISSELDAWVVPNDAAYYPGAFNIAVRDVGHFALLLSKRVAELAAENLAAAKADHRK